jgi:nitrate/nitrite transporter NarK
MYFCYNFNLNVYNDWFPTYLHDSRGMTLAKMGIYASLPLFAGTLGDLLGGWCSDRVLKRTGNVNLARRWVAIAGFLLSAAATIPAVLTHDPKGFRSVLLRGVLRARMDCGYLLGGAAGYWRRFCRVGSAVMNTLGNVGGAMSAAVVT